jgi:hypothetical protein
LGFCPDPTKKSAESDRIRNRNYASNNPKWCANSGLHEVLEAKLGSYILKSTHQSLHDVLLQYSRTALMHPTACSGHLVLFSLSFIRTPYRVSFPNPCGGEGGVGCKFAYPLPDFLQGGYLSVAVYPRNYSWCSPYYFCVIPSGKWNPARLSVGCVFSSNPLQTPHSAPLTENWQENCNFSQNFWHILIDRVSSWHIWTSKKGHNIQAFWWPTVR